MNNLQKRLRHLIARREMLEKMQEHIGTAAMGDYICFANEAIWLSEDEAFDVISCLIKKLHGMITEIENNINNPLP